MPIGRTALFIYVTGVLAAAQLGKMPTLMPVIAADLGIGLVVGAVVISLIEAGGAAFGALAAAASARLRYHRTLLCGLACLVAGGLGEAGATGSAMLIAFRAVESLGYLCVIVSAPVLMTRAARRLSPHLSLVLWSTFLPVGFALGAIASAAIMDASSWRFALLAWAILGLALLVTAPRLAPLADARDGEGGHARWPSRPALIAALGFGCFTCFQVGLLALIPAFLIAEKAASPGLAGLVAGLGGFATISGAVVPVWLSRHRGDGTLPLSLPTLVLSLIVPACLAFLVFAGTTPLALAAGLFLLLNMVSGIFPALVFASLPRLAGLAGIGPANGAIAQAGASGSLLGPPLYALFVARGGWMAAAAFGLAVSALAVILLLIAERRLAAARAAG